MTTDPYEVLLRQISHLLEQIGVPVSAITPQAHFSRDLGMDSLDSMDMMMRMEREFGISIPDEHMNQIQTVDQAIRYLQDAGTPGQTNAPRKLPSIDPDEFTHS